MEISTNEEHRLKALGFSTLLYIAFLAALFFFKLFYEPLPEPIAMGVDLNYGVDLMGSGDIQTLNKANASKNNYDVKPAEKQKKATKPQSKPTPTPVTSPPVKVKATKAKTAEVLTSETEKTPVISNKNTGKATSTNTTPAKSTSTPTPPAPAPTRKVDQGSIFKKGSTSSGSNGTVGTKSGVGGNSNGNGPAGTVGDAGSPKGTIDGKSIYGNPGAGGSGGASINISGWNKKSISLPKDESDETGTIVFKVTIDDRGDVQSILVAKSTVSPSVTNFYKSYLQRKLSSFLTPSGVPPAKSSGTITINITSGN